MRLLVGVRLLIETPDGGKVHSKAVDVREYGEMRVLEAALAASHAAFELAYQALGVEIKPAGLTPDSPTHSVTANKQRIPANPQTRRD